MTPPASTPAPTLPKGEPCALTPANSLNETCPMPAGDYHSRAFAPGVSFTLAGDWRNVSNESDVVAITDNVGHWLTFVSGAMTVFGIGATETVSDPKRAMELWKASLENTVTSLKAGSIDGLAANVFAVGNNGESTEKLFNYPTTPGSYFLDAGVTVRIFWLTIDAQPTLVILEAPTGDFQTWVESQQPFLDSIAFD